MQSFEQRLRNRLYRIGVIVDEWGLPGSATQTFQKLLEELEDGSAQMSDEEDPLACLRQSVCLEAFYKARSGNKYLLQEESQEYLWPGRKPVKKDRKIPYLSESRLQSKGETAYEAAQRCFWEETDQAEALVREHLPLTSFLTDPRRHMMADSIFYVSDTFPGLPTIRTRTFVCVRVPNILYSQHGYQVLEGNVRTKSKYRRIPDREKPLVLR